MIEVKNPNHPSLIIGDDLMLVRCTDQSQVLTYKIVQCDPSPRITVRESETRKAPACGGQGPDGTLWPLIDASLIRTRR